MTLLQLQYFVQTVRSGSTLQASQILNVSQSTVSTAIKALEAELGVNLFSRSSKGLLPNQAGYCLLSHANEILAEVDATVCEIKKYAPHDSPVQIGLPVILSANYWPDLFLLFREKAPEMEFSVTNRGTRTLINMLEKNQLDLVISLESISISDKIRKEILIDKIRRTVSVSAKNPLATEKSVTYSQLTSFPVLGYEGDEVKAVLLQKKYEEMGKHLTYVQRCSQISTLLQLLKKDVGIAYLNEKLTENVEGIVTIPLEESGTDFPLCIFWNSSAASDRRIKKIVRLTKEYFEHEGQL